MMKKDFLSSPQIAQFDSMGMPMSSPLPHKFSSAMQYLNKTPMHANNTSISSDLNALLHFASTPNDQRMLKTYYSKDMGDHDTTSSTMQNDLSMNGTLMDSTMQEVSICGDADLLLTAASPMRNARLFQSPYYSRMTLPVDGFAAPTNRMDKKGEDVAMVNLMQSTSALFGGTISPQPGGIGPMISNPLASQFLQHHLHLSQSPFSKPNAPSGSGFPISHAKHSQIVSSAYAAVSPAVRTRVSKTSKVVGSTLAFVPISPIYPTNGSKLNGEVQLEETQMFSTPTAAQT